MQQICCNTQFCHVTAYIYADTCCKLGPSPTQTLKEEISMNKPKFQTAVLATAVTMTTVAAPNAQADVINIAVTCPDNSAKIVSWHLGDIKAGADYLAVATGTLNPGCSATPVQTYDPRWPVEVHEGLGGVAAGLAPIALIARVLLWW